MAMISYGIFATAFGAAVAYLAQGTRDRFAWLPSHKTLDEVAYRAVIIGFGIVAMGVVGERGHQVEHDPCAAGPRCP